MILHDISSSNRISESGRVNSYGSDKALVKDNNPLAGLKAGDSVSAQIVARDGNTVKLQLPSNTIVEAKISGNIPIEEGKSITFEVKSTASGITLSPLQTNLSSDPNISKALAMAGLPLTSDTAAMTKSMMQAGMSVDRNSLVAMFRDISNYPESSVTNIVDLHRLGIEVNSENLSQIESYKNLSHQVGEGMRQVADDLLSVVDNLYAEKDYGKATALFDDIISMAAEYSFEEAEGTDSMPSSAQGITVEIGESERNDELKPNGSGNAEIVDGGKNAVILSEGEKQQMSAADKALMLLNAMRDSEIMKEQPEVGIKEAAGNVFTEKEFVFDKKALGAELNGIMDSGKDYSAMSLDDIFKSLKGELMGLNGAEKQNRLMALFQNQTVKASIFDALKQQWSISPAEVSQKDNIKALYEKLTRQLSEIEHALENAGAKQSPAASSVANMSANIDFLNQVNQMYSYIQLPLKLSAGNEAHGDLYVYSNGRRLSAQDGKVTALLHLDMEHLGPLDVFVALDNSGLDKKVSTQFTVADDSILDFLSDNMDMLTKRLEAKGYTCRARLTKKGNEPVTDGVAAAENGAIGPVLDMTGSMKLADYSFDVRT